MFDGVRAALWRERELKKKVREVGVSLKLLSVYFREDKTGRLYTRLKGEVAQRVGIKFEKIESSFDDPVESVIEKIRKVCEDPKVTGMLIQKPAKKNWEDSRFKIHDLRIEFNEWWEKLTEVIDPVKDADGLSPGRTVLPATVRAIMTILSQIENGDPPAGRTGWRMESGRVVIVGRSEIVGKPLAAEIDRMGAEVKLVGSTEHDLGAITKTADILVSATGKEKLITAEMVKPGVMVVDVGEPKGDVDFAPVAKKASFITPVPGGVGPMTVVSLLENVVEIASKVRS